MEIKKAIRSKIERDYFFVVGDIDLDAKYFINKIEEGIKDSPLNYKTNIQGKMTDWNFFINIGHVNIILALLQVLLLPL